MLPFLTVKFKFVFLIFICLNVWAYAQVPHWQQINNAPFSRRDGVGALVFKDKAWLIGGWDPYQADHLLNEVWSSADGENWTLVDDNAPWNPRHCAGYVVFDDKMWLISGDGNDDVWYTEDGQIWVNALKNAPWGKRYKPYVIVYKQKIWLMGGLDVENNYEPKNDVWSTNDGINWELVAQNASWAPRGIIHGGVIFNDKLWVIGGGSYGNIYNSYEEEYYNDVWNTEDGVTWNLVTAQTPWLPRIHHSINVYADRIWVIAGHNYSIAGLLADAWYSPDGKEWKVMKNVSWWGRHAASIMNFKGKMWMILGFLFNDLWNLEINGLTFLTSPVTQVERGGEYYYACSADFQKKEDSILYRFKESPYWLAIDSLTGELKGTAPCDFTGNVNVMLEAYTRKGESTIQSYIIEEKNKHIFSVSIDGNCSGNDIILQSDTVLDNYLWSTGDTTPTVKVVDPGLYQLYFMSKNGCTDSSNVIEIAERPEIITDSIVTLGETLSTQYNRDLAWYRDSVFISNDSVIVADQYGVYTAHYTGSSCESVSEPLILNEAIHRSDNSEEDIDKDPKENIANLVVKIHPNPTSSDLFIDVSAGNVSGIKFEVYSLNGQLIVQGQVAETGIINLSSLENGIYYIKIPLNNGYSIYKVIKM